MLLLILAGSLNIVLLIHCGFLPVNVGPYPFQSTSRTQKGKRVMYFNVLLIGAAAAEDTGDAIGPYGIQGNLQDSQLLVCPI